LDKTVPDENPGIAVLGPTASGKSGLAIALALRFSGEVVNCDAFQIYRGMDIGTAKVLLSDQKGVRHHMLDLQNPDMDFSAGEYQRQARAAVREISSRGKLPFVVGGTGFYLRALIEGLFEGPSRSEELRARMREIIKRKGPLTLYHALQRVDPECAARIAPMDAERIIRAYEVYLVSHKSMTWWQNQPKGAFEGFRWLKIGIDLPREQLYRRIDRRVDAMFHDGLLEETRGLLENFSHDSQAFKAIGYRQAAACFNGKMTVSEAIEETKKQSRHYAKRQLTWFRADPEIVWLDGNCDPEELQSLAENLVTDFLSKWKSSEI
jgi:tRNA dimethylallyltransferase